MRRWSGAVGGGIQFVAVPIDYLENTRVLTDELRAHASNCAEQIMSEVVPAFDRAAIARLDGDVATELAGSHSKHLDRSWRIYTGFRSMASEEGPAD